MSLQSGSPLRSFFASFWDLRQMPRALWIVITAYVIESMAYFGILTLMTTFLSGDLRNPRFGAASFTDAPALVLAIQNAPPDSATAIIRARLGSEKVTALRTAPPATLPGLLATNFNQLLAGPVLASATQLQGVPLPPAATNLLNQFEFRLAPEDLLKPEALALRLRQPTNGLATLLAARLSVQTHTALSIWSGAGPLAAELRAGLATDLSVLITGPSLGDEAAIRPWMDTNAPPAASREALAERNRNFLAAALPEEVASSSPPTLKEKAFLNRLILEATFPTTIKSGHALGIGDRWAGVFVSMFTMAVTLFTIFFGGWLEKLGVRRAMLVGLFLCLVGRSLYSAAPWFGDSWVVIIVVLALIINAAGPAITSPIGYAGVKQYTDERTNSMGYGLIYALMNLGIVGIGTLSAWARPSVQAIQDRAAPPTRFLGWLAGHTGSGVQAVNWLCAGITLIALLFFLVFMTRKTEAAKLRPDTPKPEVGDAPKRSWPARFGAYFTEGPFANTRFLFFIFMLLPVRTMFAHQWLTMPSYILRAYDKPVADKMEWLVNWINPGIIFIGVPIFTALTRRINVYTMMMIGTLISALPTFLLSLGARLDLLITYFVVFSIGEALWSARFYEYASELAPPGKVAQYMGLANIPWLLAKGTTGFYSGVLLDSFYPARTEAQSAVWSGWMWVIYGAIAMSSPIGLWLARKWVMAGLHQKPASA